MNRFSALVIVLIVVASSTTARAGLILGFGQSSYSANPNSTVDVDVFLEATAPDTGILLATGTDRLFSLGVRVNNNQIGTGARVVNASDIVVNTATFNDAAAALREVGSGFAKAQGLPSTRMESLCPLTLIHFV